MKIEIVRSARKTITISITSANLVTVHCPKYISDERLAGFIESKRPWIERVVNENEVRHLRNRTVLDYKQIYINGKLLPLVIADRNCITPSAFYVKDIKFIKDTVISTFSDALLECAENISDEINLKAKEFSVKSYKSRWGCCDKDGNIVLNYLLIMLPSSLQRYVIIHELCHTVHLNHSSDFWKLVKRFEPNYDILRQQLKEYDFITNLY